MELIKQSKELLDQVQTEVLTGVSSRRALTKFRVKRTTRGLLALIGQVAVIGMAIGVIGIFALIMLVIQLG